MRNVRLYGCAVYSVGRDPLNDYYFKSIGLSSLAVILPGLPTRSAAAAVNHVSDVTNVTFLQSAGCIVDTGIIVTSQKRQDLRIQLQKRARRRAEKKIEYLEDDKNWKEVSISNENRIIWHW